MPNAVLFVNNGVQRVKDSVHDTVEQAQAKALRFAYAFHCGVEWEGTTGWLTGTLSVDQFWFELEIDDE